MENVSNDAINSPEMKLALQNIRDLPSQLLEAIYGLLIPANLAVPSSFWDPYSSTEKSIGHRACLLLWTVTQYKFVPRPFQLQATIALLSGSDTLIDVGTGYGKTLCMILPSLMYPNQLQIVFSPLKRLQVVQVAEFLAYGLNALAINEDTPHDPELYKAISRNEYSALIVQPEQLFSINGHLPRLGRLMQNNAFVKLITRVHVDEAHFIYTAGTDNYGLPAFRRADQRELNVNDVDNDLTLTASRGVSHLGERT